MIIRSLSRLFSPKNGHFFSKNAAIFLKIAPVAEELESKINKEASEKRQLQVGKADQSEKIRTYNILQDRVQTIARMNLCIA